MIGGSAERPSDEAEWPFRAGSAEPTLQSVTMTALVVSADPAVRSDWARYFQARGLRTIRCAGPQVMCALLDGRRCPLHDEATIAIYDRASLTPEFTIALIRAGRSVPIAFATDRLDLTGRHEPDITSVAPRHVASEECVGLPPEQRVR